MNLLFIDEENTAMPGENCNLDFKSNGLLQSMRRAKNGEEISRNWT